MHSDQKIAHIAKVCHEANKAFCETCGDYSQVSWEDAPANIQQSAIDGVRYALDNPLVTPADQHDNWRRFKERDGWVYGPVKDPVAKTHPCMVEYEQLPAEQQAKDMIFGAVVKALTT